VPAYFAPTGARIRQYTNRIPITQEFYPTDEEQRLYDLVSGLPYPAPESLRSAVAPAKVDDAHSAQAPRLINLRDFRHLAGPLVASSDAAKNAEEVNAPTEEVSTDFETLEEVEDEWEEDGSAGGAGGDDEAGPHYAPEQIEEMKQECGDAEGVQRPGEIHRKELEGRSPTHGFAAWLR